MIAPGARNRWRQAMMSQERNDRITRTGRGRPAGEVLRRYWQPAALADELGGERPVVPVTLLGERLVLFRDNGGELGLIGRHCLHRGADLCFGRREDNGLRCPFHGWHYDRNGQCVEQPGEPEGSQDVQADPDDVLSGRREERHRLRLDGSGRATGISRIRLFPGARDPCLRVQGPVGVQLAAGAGNRHRPCPCLVPASLPRGRRSEGRLRQAVPRPRGPHQHAR